LTKLERKEVLEISKANFIDENGNYIKEVSGSFILSRSDETKLDVAIVKEEPLTVKLVDFGKILFELKKKKKNNPKPIKEKEIKFKIGIAENDLKTKIEKIKSLKKVKVSVSLSGRELIHKELAIDILENVKKELNVDAKINEVSSVRGSTLYFQI
jgi:translation initiation factor IF-3